MCDTRRLNDGTVVHPPERNPHTTSIVEHAPVFSAWLGTLPMGTSTRCACDPLHPGNRREGTDDGATG
jgi:hypothetical protein